MHAVLATIGTHGDVAPYLGLGERLQARGHRVTLVTNEPYAGTAAELGFEFRTLMSTTDIEGLLGDPDFWHPAKGPLTGSRRGGPLIPAQFELLADLVRQPETVLIANPGVLAARLAHDKFGCPLATIILQPWMIPSSSAPPVMPAGPTLPAGLPGWTGALYWRLFDGVADWMLLGRINRFRRELDLAPVSRLPRWMTSPQLILGMFPDWYAMPQADWAPQIRLTGFPLYDGPGTQSLPMEVQEFFRKGAAPVVFTAGTGMQYAAEFFKAAVEACERLGVRGMLLTRHSGQIPGNLPPDVSHFAFASFLQLFSRCCAVVHHGGIGTTARAIAAGVPQVIVPQAWDQFDNARRVERMGLGISVSRRSVRRGALASALRNTLESAVRERCSAVRGSFRVDDGLEAAADQIEELARPFGR